MIINYKMKKNKKEVLNINIKWKTSSINWTNDILKVLKDNPDDIKIVLSAVNVFWWNLMYASDWLKNNKEVVLAAVNNYWRAINYASESLKIDKQVILASIKNSYFKKRSVV